MKQKLFAMLAVALAGLLAGCESGTSGSDPEGTTGSSPVGTWSRSDASVKTVLAIGSDGSYAKTTTTSAGGISGYQKMSGTWKSNGNSLNVSLTRSEASNDGKSWTGADLPSPVETVESFLVNGNVLSLTLAGIETRYVQGTGGEVPEETMEAPAITPGAGSFTSAQTVSIVALNAGAEIRYTLDGSAPSANSRLYESPFQVSATTTIKALAIKNGKSGPVALATITIRSGSGSGSTALVGSWTRTDEDDITYLVTLGADGVMTLLVTDPSAPPAYRYDRISGTWSSSGTDLVSELTAEETSSDMSNWKAATEFTPSKDESKFTLSGSKLTVVSEGETFVYTKVGASSGTGAVAAPTISPDGGSYTAAQTVAIVSATAGASVYYTLDGSAPTMHSTPLTGGTLAVKSSGTVKAIAILDGKSSAVTSATFTIEASSSSSSALVGSWGVSVDSYRETDTYNADGTFTIVAYDPSLASSPYVRLSGTYTVSGTELVRAISKWEVSDDGSSWTVASTNREEETMTWSVSGTRLRLVDSESRISEYTKR